MRIRCRWQPDLSAVKTRWNYILLCIKSLTFNSYSSTSEVLFEPVITIVDFAARWFGFAFVSLVVILTSYVVIAYYMVAIPYLKERYWPPRAYLTIAYGHYLLVMIAFHYYKGVRTDPGRPPKDVSELAVTTVCKRCILPKPPRTHHCSVCRNCVLKMDHHCPWLNNCVGHFNHRYFISFCAFMWLGTFFVMTTTWPLFHDCFDVPHKVRYSVDSVYSLLGRGSSVEQPPSENVEMMKRSKEKNVDNKSKLEIFSHHVNFDIVHAKKGLPIKNRRYSDVCIGRDSTYRNNVVFLWLLCTGVTAALGTLTAIQIRLITFGETSIEKLINDKERRKARKNGYKFVNPFHLGKVENWKTLLGFRDFTSFCRNVLVPQTNVAMGNGLVWDMYSNKQV